MARPAAHGGGARDREGTDAKAISARFGHSSIAITFDRYGHLMPGTDDALAAGLDLAFRSDNVVPLRRRLGSADGLR